MALTEAEKLRILAIEELLNELQVMMTKLSSKEQIRQIMLIRQAEFDALKERVTALESEVAILQSRLV